MIFPDEVEGLTRLSTGLNEWFSRQVHRPGAGVGEGGWR
jgi:hypothetical protein